MYGIVSRCYEVGRPARLSAFICSCCAVRQRTAGRHGIRRTHPCLLAVPVRLEELRALLLVVVVAVHARERRLGGLLARAVRTVHDVSRWRARRPGRSDATHSTNLVCGRFWRGARDYVCAATRRRAHPELLAVRRGREALAGVREVAGGGHAGREQGQGAGRRTVSTTGTVTLLLQSTYSLTITVTY